MYPTWEEPNRHFSVSKNIEFIQTFVSAISLLFDSRRGEFDVLFWLNRRICYINLCFVIFSTFLFYFLLKLILLSPLLFSSLILNLCPPLYLILPPPLLSSPTSSFPYFFLYFVSFIPSIVILYLLVSRAWGPYHHILRLSIIIIFRSIHSLLTFGSATQVPNTKAKDIQHKYTIIIIIILSCHWPFLPGTSLEPAVIPTAHASSFTLQYFPYYVWCSKYSCLL